MPFAAATHDTSGGSKLKVLIMSDMEGVSGIVDWAQVNGGAPMFEEGRKLYTEEINAAIRGAKSAGATEIVVVDCHGAGASWTFNSLVAELLDPACTWVAHHAWTGYTQLLESGCDAALFVGMHAMAGTPDGVLSHTVSSEAWYELRFNDTLVGETGINAALCGNWNCPVVLVTGDTATCREATDLLGPELTTVAVKEGLSRFSARQIPPVRAREMIEIGAREALGQRARIRPYQPTRPTTITIDLASPDRADRWRHREGVEIVTPRRVVARGADFLEAWKRIWF
jgi:D-amino peptidase